MQDQRAELMRLVQRAAQQSFQDRESAEQLADAALKGNESANDPEVASRAHRVLALVHLQHGRADEAGASIELAVAAAASAKDPQVLGEALLTRMGVRASRGDPDGALADADRAASMLHGALLIRLRTQRATVLATSLGRVEEAIAEYDAVLADESLPVDLEIIPRQNRGLQLLRVGDLDRCEGDLRRARHLFTELGNHEAVAEMTLHLAQVAARRGDFPAVFELHDQVLRSGVLSRFDPRHALDLCDAVLTAGLTNEAAKLATESAALSERAGNVPAAIESWLRRADIAIAAEEWDDARNASQRASALAASTGHDAWQARAELALIRIPPDWGGSQDLSPRLIRTLEDAGWADDAADARIVLAGAALARDDVAAVAAILAETDQRPGPSGADTLRARCRRSHALALRQVAADEPGKARQTIATALRAIDRARGQLGAEDLRSSATDRSVELTRLGLHLAVEAGEPRSILGWVERQRATALRLALPHPIVDPSHVAALDELRAAPAERRRQLEETVTRKVRRRRAIDQAVGRPTSVLELAANVGDRLLVEYFAVGPALHAVAIHGGRVTHVTLDATADEVRSLIDRLRFALRRMAMSEPHFATAARPVLDDAARRLDEALVAPFSSLLQRASGVVIVPTAALFQLPWAALPNLQTIDLAVAPSAHLWSVASGRRAGPIPGQPPRVAVLAGPDLPHAGAECREVARLWAGTRASQRPTVEQTLRQLEGADLAHIAAHGQFRADSPLFSSLRLHDGQLVVHDLDRASRLPATMILSACNLAAVEVGPTDDPLGFPAALFGRGVTTLIASLLPVSDAAAHTLMVDLHRSLTDGRSPATALREAAALARMQGPAQQAAADSFVTIGAG